MVFEGEQANAFALAGGRVGVFTGMLNVAANEDRLATVLDHEVAHVNARRTLKEAYRSVIDRTRTATEPSMVRRPCHEDPL